MDGYSQDSEGRTDVWPVEVGAATIEGRADDETVIRICA